MIFKIHCFLPRCSNAGWTELFGTNIVVGFYLTVLFWWYRFDDTVLTIFFCRYYTYTYTVLHINRQVLFGAGNQGNHQNFQKSSMTQKTEIFNSPNSQYFFMKISWIGPWVSRGSSFTRITFGTYVIGFPSFPITIEVKPCKRARAFNWLMVLMSVSRNSKLIKLGNVCLSLPR